MKGNREMCGEWVFAAVTAHSTTKCLSPLFSIRIDFVAAENSLLKYASVSIHVDTCIELNIVLSTEAERTHREVN